MGPREGWAKGESDCMKAFWDIFLIKLLHDENEFIEGRWREDGIEGSEDDGDVGVPAATAQRTRLIMIAASWRFFQLSLL